MRLAIPNRSFGRSAVACDLRFRPKLAMRFAFSNRSFGRKLRSPSREAIPTACGAVASSQTQLNHNRGDPQLFKSGRQALVVRHLAARHSEPN